eukprot:scaffold6526_cov55-Phaeocystis_antarctica.AAC.3
MESNGFQCACSAAKTPSSKKGKPPSRLSSSVPKMATHCDHSASSSPAPCSAPAAAAAQGSKRGGAPSAAWAASSPATVARPRRQRMKAGTLYAAGAPGIALAKRARPQRARKRGAWSGLGLGLG